MRRGNLYTKSVDKKGGENMSTFTENYNLIKPNEADYYDISDYNENMDTIDATLAATETAVEGVSDKIGEYSDTETETVFSKLNQMNSILSQGSSPIKSLQRISVSISEGKTSTTATIKTVDPTKCIIIFERLKDGSSSSAVDYTLNATSLVITHAELSNSYTLKVGFWIIEFY